MELWAHQRKALGKLRNGSVLVGGTGSGKSLTGLSYYLKVLGDSVESPIPLYIITTAKKRNEGDWEREAKRVGISEITVDSWNNIKKYVTAANSFFIFDEQRVIGSGAWVKSFLKIVKKNHWILMSATPADTWMDLIPVFIANGFYKNRTAFIREHVIYAPYVTYPKIVGYRNEAKLRRLRNTIYVLMPFKRHTTSHVSKIEVVYNSSLVREVQKSQWNPFTDTPIRNFPEEVFVIRKIINLHPSRIMSLLKIHEAAERLIIFYNFTFELELMRSWFKYRTSVSEHNGFKHDPVPEGDNWVYLVQYLSGAEAWECFTTNHMAFYSLNYSYRLMHQARGRINRNNTPFKDLYYYELVSSSRLDCEILKAFEEKRDFNIDSLKIDPRK